MKNEISTEEKRVLNLLYSNPARDFQKVLELSNNNLEFALSAYSELLKKDADVVNKLRNLLEGMSEPDRKNFKVIVSKQGIEVQAPDHFIRLMEKLELLKKNG